MDKRSRFGTITELCHFMELFSCTEDTVSILTVPENLCHLQSRATYGDFTAGMLQPTSRPNKPTLPLFVLQMFLH